MPQKIKILSVIGTRPEAIKMASVIQAFGRHPERIISKVCLTAQHRELLDQALEIFEVSADHDLDLMEESQTPSRVGAAVIKEIGSVLEWESPDWVLVQGDTVSAAAAALAAVYAGIRVGHIEAGLRTGDPRNPFPEELNRTMIGSIASFHFAPTETARANLISEGIVEEDILVTGNTGIDGFLKAMEIGERLSQGLVSPRHGRIDSLLAGLDPERRIILATVHRRESQGVILERICLALREIAERYAGDAQVVFPVHPNPIVKESVQRVLGDVRNVCLLPPVDYLSMIQLMKRSYLILTDSGGIQEEAPVLGKPVLVLREKTERVESLEARVSRLVGTDRAEIVAKTAELFEDRASYQQMARKCSPYGDGLASKRIADFYLRSGE